MQLAAILTASVFAVERCPIGYVAFDNGASCCATDSEDDFSRITYESTSCGGGHSCLCGSVNGSFDGSVINFDLHDCDTAPTTPLICEQFTCPASYPFAYAGGKRCCESDPGGYNAASCDNDNSVFCPGDAILYALPMDGACGDYINSAEDLTLNNQTTLSNEASSSELPTGAIIGIVAGSVAFLTVAYFGVTTYCIKRKGPTSLFVLL